MPKQAQQQAVENVRRSLQPVLPPDFEGRATKFARERRQAQNEAAAMRAEAASERVKKREAEELFYAAAMDERAASRAQAASERMIARESKKSFEAEAAARKASGESLKGTLSELRKKTPAATPEAKSPELSDKAKAIKAKIAEYMEAKRLGYESVSEMNEAQKLAAIARFKKAAKDRVSAMLERDINAADEIMMSKVDTEDGTGIDIKPGTFILQIRGKYRLYGVNAGLIGVFRTKEEAIKRGKK